jgi:tight adherence protein C
MEILLVLIFGAAFTLGVAGYSMFGADRVRRRLARLTDGSRVSVEVGDDRGLLESTKKSFWEKFFAPFAARAARKAEFGSIRTRLIHAGYRRDSALSIYMGSRVLLALTLPFLVLFLISGLDITRIQMIALLCGSAAIGMVAPSFWLDRVRNARQLDVLLALPDALDLMVVCVEAGLGINASLARIASEFQRTNPTLSNEFELVNLEARAGKSTTDALRSLADRTGVTEVSSLVAMLVQTERFGTSLADTLRVHAEGLRTHRMLRAEEQAGKAPLKMLFPTLIIFIATMIVTLGPGLIQMFAFFGDEH